MSIGQYSLEPDCGAQRLGSLGTLSSNIVSTIDALAINLTNIDPGNKLQLRWPIMQMVLSTFVNCTVVQQTKSANQVLKNSRDNYS